MRRLLLASCLAVATLSGCAGVSINESAGIERVLAAPSRSAADRERDARDKPAEVLALAKFKRGDSVADILAGGGYYSEILSGIVGPNGKVLLVNNPGYEAFGRKGLAERLAGDRLPNVTHLSGPTEALGMGEGVLDGAVIVMSYHDLYWVDEKEGWPKVDAGQFLDQVVRALKPGGVLLVVDHAALPGSGISAADSLHRIDPEAVKSDLKAAGFVLESESPLLADAADPHTASVFDPAIRGKTDQFVLVFRKPR